MRAKLAKTLLALLLALSLTLNGGAMTSAHEKPVSSPSVVTPFNYVTPCRHAKNGQRHHPCCPKHSPDKYFCTADCCTSVVPVALQPHAQFTFIVYKQRPHPVLPLMSRIAKPPSRPP